MPSFSNWRVFLFAMLIALMFFCSTMYIGYKIEQVSKDVASELHHKMYKGSGG